MTSGTYALLLLLRALDVITTDTFIQAQLDCPIDSAYADDIRVIK